MTSFPTTLVPDDISAVTTKLGDLSKSHTDHHQAVDERLGELQTALGKIDLTGYGDLPTMFDPASTVWSDGTWWGYIPTTGGSNWVFGRGADVDGEGAGSHHLAILDVTEQGQNLQRDITFDLLTESTDRNAYVDTYIRARINAVDGTHREGCLDISTDLAGHITFEIEDDRAYGLIKANAGQTEAILDLQASDATSVLNVTGDKKIGFYNKAPVALQTGVAVNSAGIHAALVNLGLITA